MVRMIGLRRRLAQYIDDRVREGVAAELQARGPALDEND
jgi:hypothetical protein